MSLSKSPVPEKAPQESFCEDRLANGVNAEIILALAQTVPPVLVKNIDVELFKAFWRRLLAPFEELYVDLNQYLEDTLGLQSGGPTLAVPMLGALAGPAAVYPLVMSSAATVSFSAKVTLGVGAAMMLAGTANFAQRYRRDEGVSHFRFHLLLGSACLLTGLADLAILGGMPVIQQNVPAIMALADKPLILLFLAQELLTTPIMFSAVGQLAGMRWWRTLPVVAGTLSAFALFCAAESSLYPASYWLLLVSGQAALGLVAIDAEFVWPEFAHTEISRNNEHRVKLSSDMNMAAWASMSAILAFGHLGYIGEDHELAVLMLIDTISKVGTGHLILKCHEAMEGANRYWRDGFVRQRQH